jgi:hypothetical protein
MICANLGDLLFVFIVGLAVGGLFVYGCVRIWKSE